MLTVSIRKYLVSGKFLVLLEVMTPLSVSWQPDTNHLKSFTFKAGAHTEKALEQ